MSDLTTLQERAAQLYVSGKTKSDAYREAGYSTENCTDKTINEEASKLFSHPKVSTRVNELKKQASDEFMFSRKEAFDEFEEARIIARLKEEASAMISATEKKSRLFGLFVDKVEHTGKDGGAIETKNISDNEIARRIAFILMKAKKEKESVDDAK